MNHLGKRYAAGAGPRHGAAQRWIDGSRARLTTGTGRRPADGLLGQGSLDWLRAAMGETG